MTFWPVSMATMTSVFCKFATAHKSLLRPLFQTTQESWIFLLKCLYQMWKNQLEAIVNHFSPTPVTIATKNQKNDIFTTIFSKYAIFH